MFADIQVTNTFAEVNQQETAKGTIVNRMLDYSFVLGSELLVDFKDSNGDPYGIGRVTGKVSVTLDAKVTLDANVEDGDNFYIKRMGGYLAAKSRVEPIWILSPSSVDPRDTDSSNSIVFIADTAETPSTVTADVKLLAFTEGGEAADVQAFVCTGATAPFAHCSGPWFTYAYVEVCPKNPQATKAPVQANPAPINPIISDDPYIGVVFLTTVSDEVRTAFQKATNHWNNILYNTGGNWTLPAGTTDAGGLGQCNGAKTKFADNTVSVSRLTIFADFAPIDGIGKVLGSAGPCAFSYTGVTPSTYGTMLPSLGVMKFDEVDMTDLATNGLLEDVIMHEMGHVIGIGTMWESLRVGSAGDADNDPRYVGVNGVEGYKQIGGPGESTDIPLANTGGEGTENAHWRESTFGNELMTGEAAPGLNPLSIMTIKSLQDLGYIVNEDMAEVYNVLSAQNNDLKAGGASVTFGNDVLEFIDVHKYNEVVPTFPMP